MFQFGTAKDDLYTYISYIFRPSGQIFFEHFQGALARALTRLTHSTGARMPLFKHIETRLWDMGVCQKAVVMARGALKI